MIVYLGLFATHSFGQHDTVSLFALACIETKKREKLVKIGGLEIDKSKVTQSACIIYRPPATTEPV